MHVFGLMLNYLCQLRKKYEIVKRLKDQSGFGWDEARQTVTASNEVWDAYLVVSS